MIRLRGITKTLTEPNGETRILFDDLAFEFGGTDGSVAVLGRSGSGKTTFLRMLAGLELEFHGDYEFFGRSLEKSPRAMARHRREQIGFVAQDYALLDDRSVVENVRLGAVRPRESLRRARECLDLVGVPHLARKRPRHLSGGEAQRVAIARALMNEPAIVLADEPTGALDEITEMAVLDIFRNLQAEGTRFVIATHSDRVAAACARRVVLSGGRLAEVG